MGHHRPLTLHEHHRTYSMSAPHQHTLLSTHYRFPHETGITPQSIISASRPLVSGATSVHGSEQQWLDRFYSKCSGAHLSFCGSEQQWLNRFYSKCSRAHFSFCGSEQQWLDRFYSKCSRAHLSFCGSQGPIRPSRLANKLAALLHLHGSVMHARTAYVLVN